MTGVPVFIAGHSLGAAEAALYARSRVKRGLRVDGLYMFACPRPGDGRIGADLHGVVPVMRSLKNEGDGVTDVPLDVHVSSLGWDYDDVIPFETFQKPPPLTDFLLDPFFAHHHIAHYVAGTYGLPAGPGAIGVNEAVDQVNRLYDTADGWTWINPVDGFYWAMWTAPTGAKLMIRRGSKTGRDWFGQDFDFGQIDVQGAKVSRGFWSGIEPIENELDAALA